MEREGRCRGGSLGTWAPNIIHQFTLKDDLWRTLIDKLGSSDAQQQAYVFRYFLKHAEDSFSAPPHNLIEALNRGLEAGDVRFKEVVDLWQIDDMMELREPDNPWRKPFEEALANFTPATTEAEITDEDIPF